MEGGTLGEFEGILTAQKDWSSCSCSRYDVIERAVVRGRSGCFQLDFVGPEECGECGRVCREAAKLSKVFEETIYNILPPPPVEVPRMKPHKSKYLSWI